MNPNQQWQACPTSLAIDDGTRRVLLEKHDDYYALAGSIPTSVSANVICWLDQDLAIVRGPPPSDETLNVNVLPVYTATTDSPPAVATGRVFVRLEQTEDARAYAPRIEALGFTIREVPVYAPNCAWLVARSGVAADALRRLGTLEHLPHVAKVEPELRRQMTPKLP